MSLGGIVVILVLIIGAAAIAYVWSRVTAGGLALSDGTPGSVLDSTESVRRVDLGTNNFIGQQAQDEFAAMGLRTQLVSLEDGAFGIGMGAHYYLVYNAEDEAQILPVIDRLLGPDDDVDSGRELPDDLDLDDELGA